MVELSLGLPLFDRKSDAARAEALRTEGRQWRTRAAARRARSELARAWEDLAAAREEARVLDRELVPEAETTYRATLEAYVADDGRAGIVDVLDTQQALFEFRLRGTVQDPRWYPENFSTDLLEKLGLRGKSP